ncbi:MAG: DUF1778 domain-containing protein [Akkermansiaceae bacterium]|nr:DUF1778 domain-containing protein [Akkermansiaceae bacterium]
MKTTTKTAAGKRGRPPGAATKRINTRFPAGLAEKIEYAAAVRGVAVSAFIHEAVAERADQVIEAESRWLLARAEAANLSAVIDHPPKPDKKGKEAAKPAASPATTADWILEPPANTRLLTDPFANPDWREDANLGSSAAALLAPR